MCTRLCGDANAATQVTIQINYADVKWVKTNKELRIDNRLFDVTYFDLVDSKLVVTGVYDEDEETMLVLLENLLPEDEDEEHLNTFSLAVLLFPIQFSRQHIAIQNFETLKKNYTPYCVGSLPLICKMINVPPPNFG